MRHLLTAKLFYLRMRLFLDWRNVVGANEMPPHVQL